MTTAQNTATDTSATGVRHFMGGITDLRFGRYLSMQLLPIFYVLLLFGAAIVVAAITGLVFWLSPWWGLAALAIAPVAWLVIAAVVRAALEFLVMAYRIMLTVQNMNEVAGHVASLSGHIDLLQSRLEGITDNVQDIHAGFGEIRHEIQHVRNQVDTVTATVDMARPVLRPLGAAQRFMGGLKDGKRPKKT
jgi:uncharacterized protein YoxC